MYIIRVWKPLLTSDQQKSELFESSESHLQNQMQLTRYDFGGFVGDLIEDSKELYQWKCWEVLKRVKENGCLIETLRSVTEDWVPFELVSCETYPIKLNKLGYELGCWLVKDSEKEESSFQEPELKGSEAVLPREQVRRPKAAAREYILQTGKAQQQQRAQQQHQQQQQRAQQPQGLQQQKRHMTGKKASQPFQPSQQTSSNQTSREQPKEQYLKQWEEPLAQTWTPLSQIVQESGSVSKQSQLKPIQDSSYRRQKDSRSYLHSQLPTQRVSKAHRNPTSHQPNTPS